MSARGMHGSSWRSVAREPARHRRRRQERTTAGLGLRSIVNTRHWDFSCPAAALVDPILAKAASPFSYLRRLL